MNYSAGVLARVVNWSSSVKCETVTSWSKSQECCQLNQTLLFPKNRNTLLNYCSSTQCLCCSPMIGQNPRYTYLVVYGFWVDKQVFLCRERRGKMGTISSKSLGRSSSVPQITLTPKTGLCPYPIELVFKHGKKCPFLC